MVKFVNIPLTDVYGRDFVTGKYIPPRIVEQEQNLKNKINKWLIMKRKEAKKLGRIDDKIYVEGLGWVTC